MRRSGTHAEQGFTIIEVLVAATLLLTGLLGAAQLSTVANKSTDVASARDGATSIARRLAEAARSVPARDLDSAGLMTTLRTAAPDVVDADTTDAAWTVSRRGFTYTIAASVCTLDDASDGIGTTHDPTYCSNAAATLPADAQPADYKQVSINVTYKVRGRSAQVKQVTEVPVGANTGLPGVSLLRMTAPVACTSACPPITTSTAKIDFSATTTNAPATFSWLLDGNVMGTCPPTSTGCSGTANAWSFSWTVGTPTKDTNSGSLNYQKCIAGPYTYDGVFDVAARPQDALGRSADDSSLSVTLNRCAAIPAPNFAATERDANTSVIDTQWDSNPEGDIVGYRVYKGTSTTSGVPVCPPSVSAGQVIPIDAPTRCTDTAPPAYPRKNSPFYYSVYAVDRDPAGTLREGAISYIDVNSGNRAPNPPTALTASAGSSGRTLTFKLPSTAPLDPDPGDTIDSFRIYRRAGTVTGSPAIADRLDNETLAALCPSTAVGATCTYLDTAATTTSTYWVTAVDTHLRESVVLGPTTA